MAGNQTAWGLDVGVSSLKAIKLRRDGDRVTIEAFDVIEHDKFLTEPDVDRDALIRATLQKFVAKNAVRRDVVFIGVPGSSTFARFVKLPPVETKKIPEIVRFEAAQQIPFPLDQVNWDFHTFQHPDSPDVEVGIFAMKKELVAQVMANFRSADLNIQGVQMSPLAVYNGAKYDGMTQDKGTVVIDMGAEHTDLVVMDQGRVWLRSINIGGNHFTDALAKSFKQPFARAESLKKTAATSKYQKQIYQAMRPIFADLVAEIQRSLGAYNSAHRDSRLERVVGMGNPFKLPNLQKYLQQELKMDVERLENYRMANVEKAAAFSENILSMTTAYGLAVQALGFASIDTNLLPTEMARAMMWKKKEPWFISSAALIAVGALAIGGQWYGAKASTDSSANRAARTTNDVERSKAQGLVDQWRSVNDSFETSRQAVEDQMQLLAGRKVWPMVLADVWGSLPRGQTQVVITDIDNEYTNALSTRTAALAASGGTPPPVQMGNPSGAGATTSPAAYGPSDHGFVVTISGYYRLPQSMMGGAGAGGFQIASAFRGELLNKADLGNKTKPYYYEIDPPGGHPVQIAPASPVGFGGASMGAAQLRPGDRPWGNVRGAYWDVFVPDMVNLPKTTNGSMGGGPSNDVPAIDVVASRANPEKPMLVTMNGCWTFSLRAKVHIMDDFKEAKEAK